MFWSAPCCALFFAHEHPIVAKILRQRLRFQSSYSRMFWFHASRITSWSRELNSPSLRPRMVFSAVTNRSSRATEGLASPASLQSEMTASSGPDGVADVIRQMSRSCCKSSKIRTGRGLLNVPDVNGNRQMKISRNTPVAPNSCRKPHLPVNLRAQTVHKHPLATERLRDHPV
jgi:hypothetical protein